MRLAVNPSELAIGESKPPVCVGTRPGRSRLGVESGRLASGTATRNFLKSACTSFCSGVQYQTSYLNRTGAGGDGGVIVEAA